MKKWILILLAIGALLKLGSWEHSYRIKDCRIAEVGNGYACQVGGYGLRKRPMVCATIFAI